MYENQKRNLKKIERIELVKKRKEIIKPKTEIKTDIPFGKIEDAFQFGRLIKGKIEKTENKPNGK